MPLTVRRSPAKAPATPFPYRKLKSNEFRVLRVLGRRDGQPNCELRTVSLRQDDDSLSWTALSYRWGNTEATKRIFLDGVTFAVRRNLHEFLLQMDRDRDRRWCFADAICIDQADHDEKASQVLLMREIYLHAREVFIWFASEQVEMKTLGGFFGNMMGKLSTSWVIRARFDEFWSRLWIVQEVLLARKLTVKSKKGFVSLDEISRSVFQKCGTGEVSSHKSAYTLWKVRCQAAVATRTDDISPESNLDQKREETMPFQLDVQPALGPLPWLVGFQIRCLRYSKGADLRSGKLLPFHEAITMFCIYNCKLHHDRAFGMLGIAQSRIQPKYEVPVIEIFADILIDCLLSLGFRKAGDDSDLITAFKKDERIAAMGNSLLTGFGIDDPLHPTVFLVVLVVCEFFVAEQAAQQLFYTISCWRLGGNRMERPLDVESMRVQLDALRAENKWIDSPWLQNGRTEDRRRCNDWVHLARERCGMMWQVWEDQNKVAAGSST